MELSSNDKARIEVYKQVLQWIAEGLTHQEIMKKIEIEMHHILMD